MTVVTAHAECPYCPRITTIRVPEEGFLKWQEEHVFIQDALPELSATNRETLISGICRHCQERVFDEDD